MVRLTQTAPAASGGVVADTAESLTTEIPVAADPPSVTTVVPVRFVPIIVMAVPPVVGPVVGKILEKVGVGPADTGPAKVRKRTIAMTDSIQNGDRRVIVAAVSIICVITLRWKSP